MNYDNIPSELCDIERWCLFNKSKMPLKRDGSMPGSGDLDGSHLMPFEEAVMRANEKDLYVGFYLDDTDNIVCIDLDDVYVEGQINSEAQEIVDRVASYTERSVSGNGVHIFTRANIDWKLIKPIEVYSSKRHILMTGDVLVKHDIECSDINWIYEKYSAKKKGAPVLIDRVNTATSLTAFGAVELGRLVGRLSSCIAGGRDNTLNEVAYLIGQIGLSQHIPVDIARNTIIGACATNGLLAEYGEDKILKKINRSFNEGFENKAIPALEAEVERIENGDLKKKNIPEMRWVVEGIIPDGLTLLAGNPKFGKSYMMLWLCHHVATGTPAWGMDNKVTQGKVLYMALEDSFRRIKHRITDVLEGFTDSNNISYQIKTKRIGEGLENEISRWVEDNPEARLIIIDTVQKVRPLSKGGNGGYATDYSDYEKLQSLAMQLGIGIVCIHHTRKTNAAEFEANPYDQISGTTGVQGVADTMMVVGKDTKGQKHIYWCGRDVSDDERVFLHSDYINGIVLVRGEAEENNANVDEILIMDFINKNFSITVADIKELFCGQKDQPSISRMMKALVKKEVIEVKSGGVGKTMIWGLPTEKWI